MSFLNQDKRLLFVHIYKNAGSSITEALRECYRNDLAYAPPVLLVLAVLTFAWTIA
jgi:hypothetical protein